MREMRWMKSIKVVDHARDEACMRNLGMRNEIEKRGSCIKGVLSSHICEQHGQRRGKDSFKMKKCVGGDK